MLTLEEIENISFHRSGLGGYKTDDVDTFVDNVILKVKDLESSNRELENRIEQLNAQIKLFKEKQESVQDAIITAEMTSKSLVRDATHKAEVLVTDANTKAENIIKEATEKSEKLISESNTKAETIINNAVLQSAKKVDENNHILENQKKLITQIQNEVTKFKEALIQSYRSHLEVINSLPKADEFKAYQEKLDEYYPITQPSEPKPVKDTGSKSVEVNEPAKNNTDNTASEKQEVKNAAEKTNKDNQTKTTASIDINKAVIEEKEEVIFSSSKKTTDIKKETVAKDDEAEDVPTKNVSANKREPVIIPDDSKKKSDTKFGVLKLDDTLDADSKK